MLYYLIVEYCYYSCKVHCGKSKIDVDVQSYGELVDHILMNWNFFMVQKYTLYVVSAKPKMVLMTDLRLLSKDKSNKIIVKNESKGFSKFSDDMAVVHYIDGKFD